MRRAGQILYTPLTTISMLLLLAMVTLWVRSYWVRDRLEWFFFPRGSWLADTTRIVSSRGGTWFIAHRLHGIQFTPNGVKSDESTFYYTQEPATAYPTFAVGRTAPFSPNTQQTQRSAGLGFEWVSFESADENIKSLTLPLYLPTLLFTLLPAHYLFRTRRHRRQANRIAQNHCPACNYDLRASPGRCPECGLVSSASPEKSG